MNTTIQLAEADLNMFAMLLGWEELRRCKHYDSFTNRETIWYEAGEITFGRDHFALQINPFPIGQDRIYEACVYAIRYRLCSGWHLFTRYRSASHLTREAIRLETWLHKSQFTTLAARRNFRHLPPECAGCSWTQISQKGSPIVDLRRSELLAH